MVTETVSHADGQVLEWKWSSNSKLMERPFWTSAYLIDHVLIDCGAPGSVTEICEFIDRLPSNSRPDRCFVTHAHEDHAGTGRILVDKYHVTVYAPAQSIPRLRADWSYPDYRKMTWGDSGFSGYEAQPYPAIITTPNGYHFEPLALPGHSPDLHALVEQQHQWAFVGDLMLPQYQMLFGGRSDIQEDIKTIVDSLQKLYDFTDGLDDLCIFVSGRGVFHGRDQIATRINEINELHEKAHAESKRLGTELTNQRKMRKMLQSLFGGESFFGGMTNGDLSRENMIVSLLKWEL